MRLRTKILFCTTALVVGVPAQAAIIRLEANLTRDQEPPPTSTTLPVTNPGGVPRPESFGSAVFFLDTTPGAEKMTMTVTVFNIDVGGPGINGGLGSPPVAISPGLGTQTPSDSNDDLVAAHIHIGTAATAGDPTFPVRWGFWGLPFNNVDNDGQMLLHPGGVGGIFTGEWDPLEGQGAATLVNQIAEILAERAYINYHTGQFGGGEIRGQLLVVPEPDTLALLGLGLLGLAGLRRRFV